MLLKREITLLVLAILQLTLAIEYRSTMVSQRISYFENPYVKMNVKFYGDEGYAYLTLQDDITPYNDLHIIVYAKEFDQPPVMLSHTPVSLCQLLHDTGVSENNEYLSSQMAQFNLQQIFNFAGKVCPIGQTTIRLSPYVFPSNFSFDESLGCGYKNIEARLMKCSEQLSEERRECETLLKNILYGYFENEHCQKDPTDVVIESRNSLLLEKVKF